MKMFLLVGIASAFPVKNATNTVLLSHTMRERSQHPYVTAAIQKSHISGSGKSHQGRRITMAQPVVFFFGTMFASAAAAAGGSSSSSTSSRSSRRKQHNRRQQQQQASSSSSKRLQNNEMVHFLKVVLMPKIVFFAGAQPPDTIFASWYDLTLALVDSRFSQILENWTGFRRKKSQKLSTHTDPITLTILQHVAANMCIMELNPKDIIGMIKSMCSQVGITTVWSLSGKRSGWYCKSAGTRPDMVDVVSKTSDMTPAC